MLVDIYASSGIRTQDPSAQADEIIYIPQIWMN
jgi:hypothetical protein